MTIDPTSPPRLAAAILGLVVVASGTVVAQGLPEVRPSDEIFGRSQLAKPASFDDVTSPPPAPAAKFPFSVLEPDWQSAEGVAPEPPRALRRERPMPLQPALIPASVET